MNDQPTPTAGLPENQARRSETSLMVGRVSALAQSSNLTADQRIGVSMAQKVLDARVQELNLR